ncbi:hypothetical protein [Actinophytocola sp.]|uniref:hypothetical protein n=1 Tax=Actinophytocola sp. TaxID=1872138 RepID=UPI002D30E9C9|nr:hypothetical protein [Actinophytocola sp.]HYQ63207.1 hypothetical protein [Actinophytocola sp.]
MAIALPTRRRHARTEDPAPPHLRLAAFLVAAVPVLVHASVALRGFYGQDDFIMTYRAAHADLLDPAFLFQDHNGHLVPGTYLLAWLETAIAPLNFTVAILPVLAFHAVMLWLFWLVLTRLFGPRWSVLPFFAALTASPLVLFPTIWWAYGMQLLPILVGMAAALLAHLRYLDTGATRYAVQAVAWTGFGLLFNEKAVLITAVLFAVTVLRGDSFGEAIVRHWRVWAANVALLAGFAVLSTALTASQTTGKPVSAPDLAEYAFRAVVDTFLPGILGGPFAAPGNGATWATPPLAVRIVAVVLAVAIIVGSKKVLPWLFLAAYVAVGLALVAVTRLADVGPAIGADPRYLADAVPVAVIFAAFAYQGRRDRRWPIVAVASLLVVGGTVSFVRVAPPLQFRDARDYVATARAALADQPGIVLYDTTVPGSIIIDWFIYDDFTSRVVGLAPEKPRFDRPAETLYQLDATGRPQPITTLTDSVRGERGPVADCGHLVEGAPVRIPLTGAFFGRRVLKLGYYTGDAGYAVVATGDTRETVRLREGLHVLYIPVTGTQSHVDVSWSADRQPLCVTDVEIGTPR